MDFSDWVTNNMEEKKLDTSIFFDSRIFHFKGFYFGFGEGVEIC